MVCQDSCASPSLSLVPTRGDIELLSRHISHGETAIVRALTFAPYVRRQQALCLQSPERASGFKPVVRQPGDPLHGFGIDGQRRLNAGEGLVLAAQIRPRKEIGIA